MRMLLFGLLGALALAMPAQAALNWDEALLPEPASPAHSVAGCGNPVHPDPGVWSIVYCEPEARGFSRGRRVPPRHRVDAGSCRSPHDPKIWSIVYCGQLSGGGTIIGGGGAPLQACFWYVAASGGSDSNNGTTETTPFATLEHAIAQAAAAGTPAAKVICGKPGTYARAAILTLTSTHNNLVIQSDPGCGLANCFDTMILDGASTSVGCGCGLADLIDILGGSSITINGLAFQHWQNDAVNIMGGSAFGVGSASGNTVENSTFGFNTNATFNSTSVFAQDLAPNTTFDHNYVHDVVSMGVDFNAFVAPPNASIDGGKITNSFIERACSAVSDCGAIYTQAINGASASCASCLGVLFQNNFTRDQGFIGGFGTNGIYLDAGSNGVTMAGNIIGPPCAGCVSNQNDGGEAFNVDGFKNTIKNNIVDLGCSGMVFIVNGWLNPGSSPFAEGDGNSFTDNIVLSCYTGTQNNNQNGNTPDSYFQLSGAPNWTIGPNVYHNYKGGTVNTQSTVAASSDSNPQLIDPQITGFQYQIAAGSPVFGAPINFKAIVGGWGPPGFVPATDTNHSNP